MYRLNPDWRMQAEELSGLWNAYMRDRVSISPLAEHALSSR
jgi:hypothetical protein